MYLPTPYLVKSFDEDRHHVGIRPGDDDSCHLSWWCEENLLDDEWGTEPDEFYSPLSTGIIYWFKHEDAMIQFLLACCKP